LHLVGCLYYYITEIFDNWLLTSTSLLPYGLLLNSLIFKLKLSEMLLSHATLCEFVSICGSIFHYIPFKRTSRVQAYLILLLAYFLRRTSLSMRTALFLAITQRAVWGVLSNYHRSLSNNPEECSSHLLRGGSLISRCFSIIMQKHVTVSYIQSTLSTAVLCYSEVLTLSTYFWKEPFHLERNQITLCATSGNTGKRCTCLQSAPFTVSRKILRRDVPATYPALLLYGSDYTRHCRRRTAGPRQLQT